MNTLKSNTRASRSMMIAEPAIDEAARTVALAFSSESPYSRAWGMEVLDHSIESIRLARLAAGGPVLMDHDDRDHVGVVESVRIDDDRVARAVVRFGRSTRAEEIFRDIQDGIRRHVSVGYMIHSATPIDDIEGQKAFRVDDWEPLEISIVSVPADSGVGIGRAADQAPLIETESMQEPVQTPAPAPIDVQSIEEKGRVAEQKRCAEILKIAEGYRQFGAEKIAARAITERWSIEQFKSEVMAKMASTPKPNADIGMSGRESEQFSVMRAINALANPTDRRAQEAAAFERECSDAVADKMGRESRGFYIPSEVQHRDLEVGTGNGSSAGKTVATDLLASSFIDLLRNRMAITQMGGQMLTGLNGNIAIPRQTGGATAYWVAESGAPTESAQAFDQLTLSPKTVGAFTDISRKLLLQSSVDIESFVRSDLATVLALAIDLAAVNGTGSNNQPTGILNTSGIGDVAGGTNGLAPALSHIIDLETDIAVANADVGSLGYLTNAKVRGALKQTFSNATYGDRPIWEGDSMNGYRARVSNQVPSNLTKGTADSVCSAIIFGNWQDLIIGQWGTLDLMVDPYSGSTSGTVRVVALQDIDVAVRHVLSFSAMLDALTA